MAWATRVALAWPAATTIAVQSGLRVIVRSPIVMTRQLRATSMPPRSVAAAACVS